MINKHLFPFEISNRKHQLNQRDIRVNTKFFFISQDQSFPMCVSLTTSNANDDHKLNISTDKESILFCCMFMVRCNKRLFKLRQHLKILSAFDKRETWCQYTYSFPKKQYALYTITRSRSMFQLNFSFTPCNLSDAKLNSLQLAFNFLNSRYLRKGTFRLLNPKN